MNTLELIIINNSGAVLGTIDVIDSNEVGFKFTKSVAKFNNISSRNTNYTLDFEVPNTANNNKILFGLSDVNASGVSRNIIGSLRCRVLVNGNQLDTGFIYGRESELNGNYKMFFKGGNADWIELIGDLELNQLPWRDKDSGNYTIDAFEEFSDDRINTLVLSYGEDHDLTYPIIDRNNGLSNAEKRPVIYFSAFWNAVANYIGYEFTGSFLEQDWVKGKVPFLDQFGNSYVHVGLAIDPPFSFTVDEADLDASYSEYDIPVGTYALGTGTGALGVVTDSTLFIGNLSDDPDFPTQQRFSKFSSLIPHEIKDDNILYDFSTSTYTVAVTGLYDLDFNFVWSAWYYNIYATPLQWSIYTNADAVQFVPPNIKWHIVKNNTANNSINGTVLYSYLPPTSNPDLPPSIVQGVDGLFAWNLPNALKNVVLNAGDEISIVLELDIQGQANDPIWNYLDIPATASTHWRLKIQDATRVRFSLKDQVQLGDTFRINNHIPRGIKVIDLIKEFKTMFNLYFDCDTNRKTVLVESRNDFYLPLTDAEDITDSIDLSTNPSLDFSTDYLKRLEFAYREDTSDKNLTRWQKFWNKTYALYTHTFPTSNRFEIGTLSNSLSLFAPSINGYLQDGSNRVVTSLIKQEWDDSKNAELPINDEYSTRIYQLVLGVQYGRDGNPLVNNSGDTPLVGLMEGFGAVPTYQDRKLTFNGAGGLVDQFYLKTLTNIDDSLLLTIKQKINLYKFFTLDLKKPLYISAPEKIKGYYLYDSVNNYDVVEEMPVTVKLIKYKDYADATLDLTQTTNVTDTITEITTPPPQVITMFDENGFIFNVLDNNGNKMYSI